jgi:catechol 2,3-dioxygenase-like lactoylglutathione lyase family enzyme
MAKTSVRYIVNDVDPAISFYTTQLAFHLDMRPDPTFAILSRGDLQLFLSATPGPGGGSRTKRRDHRRWRQAGSARRSVG